MSTHTLIAYCPLGLGEIEVEITYRFTPGRPARGPSYASGGEPADPPEVEFIAASSKVSDDFVKLLVAEWAEDWLADDHGRDTAVDNAEEA